jgi:dipeptidyl aminopeptidase/acylaminoacyl peptidase
MIRTTGDPEMKKTWFVKLVPFAVIACCALSFTSSVGASKDNLPRLPAAALLMGNLRDDLAVTVGDRTTQIQGGGGWVVIPSISANGRVVASARLIPQYSLQDKPTYIVGTYDVAGNQWTDYLELQIKGGTVAISPDGSKLACSDMASEPSLLHILDLKTGKISVGPEATMDARFLTWSPDSRRIAFDKEFQRGADGATTLLLPEIYVFNIADGTVSKIAEGTEPSWSPSGEWIAFSDYSAFRSGKYADTPSRLSLVHPDGTGSKVVTLLKWNGDLFLPAVWSPDSKDLLIERPQEDEVNPKVNIDELDVATLKITTKFRKTPQVYGWAIAR